MTYQLLEDRGRQIELSVRAVEAMAQAGRVLDVKEIADALGIPGRDAELAQHLAVKDLNELQGEPVARYVAVDPDPEALARLRERREGQAQWLRETAERLAKLALVVERFPLALLLWDLDEPEPRDGPGE